jgi:hypothetical protein
VDRKPQLWIRNDGISAPNPKFHVIPDPDTVQDPALYTKLQLLFQGQNVGRWTDTDPLMCIRNDGIPDPNPIFLSYRMRIRYDPKTRPIKKRFQGFIKKDRARLKAFQNSKGIISDESDRFSVYVNLLI